MNQDYAKAVVKVLERSIHEYTDGGIGWCKEKAAVDSSGYAVENTESDEVAKCCVYGIVNRSIVLEARVNAQKALPVREESIYKVTHDEIKRCAIKTGRHHDRLLSWWNDVLEGTEEECKMEVISLIKDTIDQVTGAYLTT